MASNTLQIICQNGLKFNRNLKINGGTIIETKK